MDLRSFFRPAAPSTASLPAPIHDKVGFLHPFDVGEEIVPKEHLLRRATPWVAHRPEYRWVLARADDQDVEFDDRTSARDHLHHPVQLNALDNEWEVDNCAPILKGCPMSPYPLSETIGEIRRRPYRRDVSLPVFA